MNFFIPLVFIFTLTVNSPSEPNISVLSDVITLSRQTTFYIGEHRLEVLKRAEGYIFLGDLYTYDELIEEITHLLHNPGELNKPR